MKSNILVLALLCLCLSGCMIWDAGYTPNLPLTQRSVSTYEKVPITYTVHASYARGDVLGIPSEKDLQEKIDDALRRTELFSDIICTDKPDLNGYHIDFSFRQDGMNVEQSMAVGQLIGLTLLLSPGGEVITFDGAAKLYLQGKPIYATAKAEEARCLIWLPLAPVGLFMNAWTTWHKLEGGTINALIEDIASEHEKRFLKVCP